MTTGFWRIYKGRGRLPRDFVGKVWASSAEEAIEEVQSQPAYRGKDLVLEAVPAHHPFRIPGK